MKNKEKWIFESAWHLKSDAIKNEKELIRINKQYSNDKIKTKIIEEKSSYLKYNNI